MRAAVEKVAASLMRRKRDLRADVEESAAAQRDSSLVCAEVAS